MGFIDRRENPKGKSLGNRQRFLERTRGDIRRHIRDAVRDRKLQDAGQEQVTVPIDGIKEPRFRHWHHGGNRDHVLPGNKEYSRGDKIDKSGGSSGGGGGVGGGSGSSSGGGGEDDFQFTLTREEFLNILFEDLELPELTKKNIQDTFTFVYRRAGVNKSGSQLDVRKTMILSLGRRIALRRPKKSEVKGLEEEINRLCEKEKTIHLTLDEVRQLEALCIVLLEKQERRRIVPYIEPLTDLRFKNFEKQPRPNTRAVMFCLMDVSGSMTQHEKDLAKQFFLLTVFFLERKYTTVDIVYIRHTHEAKEVDEHEFFYSPKKGGTIVSTALEKMIEIIKKKYSPNDWNIYAAQASDGDNLGGDSEGCVKLLSDEILPVCQYFAYIEITQERSMTSFSDEGYGQALWRAYHTLREDGKFKGRFAMKRAAHSSHILAVFHELFKKRRA